MAAPIEKMVQQHYPGVLGQRDYRKIRWYMSNCRFFGILVCRLVERPYAPSLQRVCALAGAIIAFTDLVIDDFEVPDSDRTFLLSRDFLYHTDPTSLTPVAGIFHHYWTAFCRSAGAATIEAITPELLGLMRAQADSRAQFNTELTAAEVHRITREKGGYSFTLFGALFPELQTAAERQGFFELGALDQYMNDSQDLYKDARAGIRTFAAFCPSYVDLHRILETQRDKAYNALMRMDFPRARKIDFILAFHCLLIGTQYRLRQFEKQTGPGLDRKHLQKLKASTFRVSPYTTGGFSYIFPRIASFKL